MFKVLTFILILFYFQGCVTGRTEIPASYTKTNFPDIFVEHNKRNGTLTYQDKYNLKNATHLGFSEARIYAIDKNNSIQIRMELIERSNFYNQYNTINISNGYSKDVDSSLNLNVYSEDTNLIIGGAVIFTINIPLTPTEIKKLKKILESDKSVIIRLTDNGKNPSNNNLNKGERQAMLNIINFVETKRSK